jgi:hypothetical protein
MSPMRLFDSLKGKPDCEEDEEAATLDQGRRSDAEDHGAREDGDAYDRS